MPKPLKFLPGKLPAKKDYRTLKLTQIIRAGLPPAPETFDVDEQLGGIRDDYMWLNDVLGICVVAGAAAHLLRHEKYEQGIEIVTTDAEARKDYFEQTGGIDSGLYLLDYLNHLRKDGILVGGKSYKIHAFAEVDYKDHEQVRLGIQLFRGVYFGMTVTQSMMDQFDAGQIFDVVSNPGKTLGGHCILSPAYLKFKLEGFTQVGPVFRTWAKRVQATWRFWDRYTDECFIVIDENDPWLNNPNSPLDTTALEAILAQVTTLPPPPEPEPRPEPTPPAPPKPGCLGFGLLGRIFKR